jgi:hypothetical protein
MMVSTGIFEWVASKYHDVDESFEVDGSRDVCYLPSAANAYAPTYLIGRRVPSPSSRFRQVVATSNQYHNIIA